MTTAVFSVLTMFYLAYQEDAKKKSHILGGICF